jgi:hypothetical protein
MLGIRFLSLLDIVDGDLKYGLVSDKMVTHQGIHVQVQDYMILATNRLVRMQI